MSGFQLRQVTLYVKLLVLMALQGSVILIVDIADEAEFHWQLADRLTQAGADVALQSPVNSTELTARVKALRQSGQRVLGVVADPTQPSEVLALMQSVIKTLSRLDTLIVLVPDMPKHFLALGPDELRHWTYHQALAAITVCQAAARELVGQAQPGRLLLLSFTDTEAAPHPVPSSFSMLIGSMALELKAFGISVSGISIARDSATDCARAVTAFLEADLPTTGQYLSLDGALFEVAA